MSDDLEGSDLEALRNAMRGKGFTPTKTNANSLAARRAAERKATMSSTDGRRSRGGVVRDAQLNFKVTSATKAQVVALSREMGISMIEVLERGLDLLQAQHEKAARR